MRPRDRRAVENVSSSATRCASLTCGASAPTPESLHLRAPQTVRSEIEQGVNLRRANEIVFTNPFYCVGHVGDFALVVADGDIGMMVLAVGNPRRCVDEGHGLAIVLELIGLANHAVGAGPSLHTLEYVSELDFALPVVTR